MAAPVQAFVRDAEPFVEQNMGYWARIIDEGRDMSFLGKQQAVFDGEVLPEVVRVRRDALQMQWVNS